MSRNSCSEQLLPLLVLTACFIFPIAGLGQECSQANEIPPALRTGIDNAAIQLIQYAAHGDVQSLRQAATPLSPPRSTASRRR